MSIVKEGSLLCMLLLCRHARFSLLQNQQAADERISTYYGPGDANRNLPSSAFKSLIERNKRSKLALLILVLVGTSMVITIGVLTPAVSVVSSSIDGLVAKTRFEAHCRRLQPLENIKVKVHSRRRP